MCLACSQVDRANAQASYDIDSSLGYATSLAFARQGLRINLYPRFHTNIKTNLHLFEIVKFDFGRGEKSVKVPLHDVPHYYLGRVIGHEDTNVYIFFPRMWNPEKQTNFPGSGDGEAHDLLRTWTDQILLPAIFRHVSSSSRQHIPPSWDSARRASRAAALERRGQTDANDLNFFSQSLHYPIHSKSLAAVWQDIQQQLQDPTNQVYHGAKIFFSSKNTKLCYTSLTLDETWDAFNSTLLATFNFAYLDRSKFWIDLGKEIANPDYALSHEVLAPDSTPTTYLMRACCQASFARWANLGEAGTSAKATFYPVAMLRDAQDMTVEMSRPSKKRQQGWVYSQVYNSFKEMYDAAKTKPFSHPRLNRLAWDSKVAEMLRQVGKGQSTKAKKIFESYKASKERLYHALCASRKLSFGVREEHRISLAFFDRLKESLEQSGDWTTVHRLVDDDYESFWVLPTEQFSSYLDENTNKFLAALEWTLTLDTPTRVSYEHCKLATMLLQCLPFAFDSGPIKERNDIWQVQIQRRRGKDPVLGMGIKQAISHSAYGWFLPRIDWSEMAFHRGIAHKVAFASSMLRDTYRKHGALVRDSKDDYRKVEAAGQWMSCYWQVPECRSFIIQFLLVLIMRSYRKEVFRYFKDLFESDDRTQKAAAEGKIMFCQASFQECFVDGWEQKIHLVNPKKVQTRNIQDLLELLWGFNDGIDRRSWSDAPFRTIFWRARELVEHYGGAAWSAAFHARVGRYFVATHWLIPYPTPGKFAPRNHHKQPLWIGLYHRRLAFSKRNDYRVYPAKQIMSTTKDQPTSYRPPPTHRRDERRDEDPACPGARWSPLFKKHIYERSNRWYMPDWDLTHHQHGPFMLLLPHDYTHRRVEFGASLESISQLLEQMYETERELVGSDVELDQDQLGTGEPAAEAESSDTAESSEEDELEPLPRDRTGRFINGPGEIQIREEEEDDDPFSDRILEPGSKEAWSLVLDEESDDEDLQERSRPRNRVCVVEEESDVEEVSGTEWEAARNLFQEDDPADTRMLEAEPGNALYNLADGNLADDDMSEPEQGNDIPAFDQEDSDRDELYGSDQETLPRPREHRFERTPFAIFEDGGAAKPTPFSIFEDNRPAAHRFERTPFAIFEDNRPAKDSDDGLEELPIRPIHRIEQRPSWPRLRRPGTLY